MIKFFRHIRKQLLNEGEMGKYFKYAIGEILLVVIGILIALSINNWNEGRKDALKEQQILKQLASEYNTNLKQLDEKIFMRNEMLASSNTILRYIDNPENVAKDSIFHHLHLIMRDPTFDPISNDLISSGNLHLIQNQNLKQMLSSWTSHVYQLQELELEWQKVRTEILTPFYIKSGIARDVHNSVWREGYTPVHSLDQSINATHKINTSKKSPDTKTILNFVELEGIAVSNITWSQIANIQSQALRNMIVDMLQLIESEIE